MLSALLGFCKSLRRGASTDSLGDYDANTMDLRPHPSDLITPSSDRNSNNSNNNSDYASHNSNTDGSDVTPRAIVTYTFDFFALPHHAQVIVVSFLSHPQRARLARCSRAARHLVNDAWRTGESYFAARFREAVFPFYAPMLPGVTIGEWNESLRDTIRASRAGWDRSLTLAASAAAAAAANSTASAVDGGSDANARQTALAVAVAESKYRGRTDEAVVSDREEEEEERIATSAKHYKSLRKKAVAAVAGKKGADGDEKEDEDTTVGRLVSEKSLVAMSDDDAAPTTTPTPVNYDVVAGPNVAVMTEAERFVLCYTSDSEGSSSDLSTSDDEDDSHNDDATKSKNKAAPTNKSTFNAGAVNVQALKPAAAAAAAKGAPGKTTTPDTATATATAKSKPVKTGPSRRLTLALQAVAAGTATETQLRRALRREWGQLVNDFDDNPRLDWAKKELLPNDGHGRVWGAVFKYHDQARVQAKLRKYLAKQEQKQKDALAAAAAAAAVSATDKKADVGDSANAESSSLSSTATATATGVAATESDSSNPNSPSVALIKDTSTPPATDESKDSKDTAATDSATKDSAKTEVAVQDPVGRRRRSRRRAQAPVARVIQRDPIWAAPEAFLTVAAAETAAASPLSAPPAALDTSLVSLSSQGAALSFLTDAVVIAGTDGSLLSYRLESQRESIQVMIDQYREHIARQPPFQHIAQWLAATPFADAIPTLIDASAAQLLTQHLPPDGVMPMVAHGGGTLSSCRPTCLTVCDDLVFVAGRMLTVAEGADPHPHPETAPQGQLYSFDAAPKTAMPFAASRTLNSALLTILARAEERLGVRFPAEPCSLRSTRTRNRRGPLAAESAKRGACARCGDAARTPDSASSATELAITESANAGVRCAACVCRKKEDEEEEKEAALAKAEVEAMAKIHGIAWEPAFKGAGDEEEEEDDESDLNNSDEDNEHSVRLPKRNKELQCAHIVVLSVLSELKA